MCTRADPFQLAADVNIRQTATSLKSVRADGYQPVGQNHALQILTLAEIIFANISERRREIDTRQSV